MFIWLAVVPPFLMLCWPSSSSSCGWHKGCQMSGWTHGRPLSVTLALMVLPGCRRCAGAEGSVEGKVWLS